MTVVEYKKLCNKFAVDNELDIEFEHKFIISFLKDKKKIFKIIFSEEDRKGFISFHIDLYIIKAIHWYSRLLHFNENLAATDCFIEEDEITYLGEEAEKVRETQRLIFYKKILEDNKQPNSDFKGSLH